MHWCSGEACVSRRRRNASSTVFEAIHQRAGTKTKSEVLSKDATVRTTDGALKGAVTAESVTRCIWRRTNQDSQWPPWNRNWTHQSSNYKLSWRNWPWEWTIWACSPMQIGATIERRAFGLRLTWLVEPSTPLPSEPRWREESVVDDG